MDTMTAALAERFVEVILADHDQVDAEFNAIIATAGLNLPPSLPIGTAGDGDGDGGGGGDKHPQGRAQSTRGQPHRGDHSPTSARRSELSRLIANHRTSAIGDSSSQVCLPIRASGGWASAWTYTRKFTDGSLQRVH
jgi:hypothetical protein